MRRSFIVRIPMEYRPKVVQEEIDLAVPSTLDVMGHILSDYFSRKAPPVAKSVTAVTAPVATPVTEVVTAQEPPPVTTPEPTVTTPGSTPDAPKTLYGGRIYVIS